MSFKTLEEAVADYLGQFTNADTARSYCQTLEPFARDFGRSRPLSTFTPEDLSAWDGTLKARGLASATIASNRRRMKAFWNWCVERDHVAESPARLLRIPRRRTSLVSKAIPSEVLMAMLRAVEQKREYHAAERDRAILALMVTFGARRGDVARLRLSDVNLKEGWIVLHVKGDNDVRLPLPSETGHILAAWMETRQTLRPTHPHRYVFTTIRENDLDAHRPLNVESISTMVKRLSQEVCGKAYGTHSIRHWFGQHHADNRTPPSLLQAVMGHSDVKITLDFYYDQDWERVSRFLEQTELGHDVAKRESPHRHKAKIVYVDFSQVG